MQLEGKSERPSLGFVCSLEGKVRPALGPRVPTKCQICPCQRKERIRGEVGGEGVTAKIIKTVEKQQGQET